MMRKLFKLIITLIAGSLLMSSQQLFAYSITVDADSYSHGDILNDVYYGVTLSGSTAPGNVYARDVGQDLSGNYGYASTGFMVFGRDGRHGGYIWDLGWLTNPADDHTFRADFDMATNQVSLDGIASDPYDEWTLEAFAADGTLIDSASATLVGGPGDFATLTVASPAYDIAYVMAYGSGDSKGCTSAGSGWSNGVNLDNLAFNLPANVTLDIKPGSCVNPLNTNSKGVLPVAILGNYDFDVTQVDVTSIRLMGIAPIRWSLEDVAAPAGNDSGWCDSCDEMPADGYVDLTLKFSTPAIMAALGSVEDDQCKMLELTGNLKEAFGGAVIVGEDAVSIKVKK